MVAVRADANFLPSLQIGLKITLRDTSARVICLLRARGIPRRFGLHGGVSVECEAVISFGVPHHVTAVTG
jgi:hypothetical protein